jgi:NADH dehydrogenase FAD-containing subunit
VLDKETKQRTVIPCGTCVWSTGIVPLPISREISKKLNQNSRNGVVVDSSLKAIGANNIYAIGYVSISQSS